MAQNPRNNNTKPSTPSQADPNTAVKNKTSYNSGQPLTSSQQYRKEKADARREREMLARKAAARQRLFSTVGVIVAIVVVVVLVTVVALNANVSVNSNASNQAATTAGATAGVTAAGATAGAASGSTPAAGSNIASTAAASPADQGQVTPVSGTEVTLADGLKYIDTTPGTGASPTNGQNVTVNYTGYLLNGTVFDSSVSRNQPFSFPIGTGQVIKGWDEGVLTMKVGGKRRLIIPAALAYGAQGQGTIPPNSTLIFDVELLKVG